MNITITVEQLRMLSACREGVDDFLAEYGEKAELEWTVETQLTLICGPLRRWLGWAVAKKLLPLWSMADADLTGADLTRADLARAYLTGAVLTEADLTRADLTGANLAGANLTGADLTEANGLPPSLTPETKEKDTPNDPSTPAGNGEGADGAA